MRLKSIERLAGKAASHIGIHKIVFYGPQTLRELVIGNAQLVQAAGLLFGDRPQEVLDDKLIVVQRLIGRRHHPSLLRQNRAKYVISHRNRF